MDARLETSAIDEDESELQTHRTQRTFLDVRSDYVEGAQKAQLEHRVRMIQDRVEYLEHKIPAKHSRDCRYTADEASGITHLLNELDNRVTELERQVSINKPDRQPSPRRSISPLVPFLKSTDDKTEIFGTTHWAHMFQQVIINPAERRDFFTLTSVSSTTFATFVGQLFILKMKSATYFGKLVP